MSLRLLLALVVVWTMTLPVLCVVVLILAGEAVERRERRQARSNVVPLQPTHVRTIHPERGESA